MLNFRVRFGRVLATVGFLLAVGFNDASRADTVIDVADWYLGGTTSVIVNGTNGDLNFTLDLRQGEDPVGGNFLMSITGPGDSILLNLLLASNNPQSSGSKNYDNFEGDPFPFAALYDLTTWTAHVNSSGPFTIAINSYLYPIGAESFATLPLLTLNLTGDLSVQAPVPEASTWAMMILGFAGIGFVTYRRRNSAMPRAA